MPTNNPEPNGHDVVCRFATVSELPLSPKLAVAYYNRVSGQLPVGRQTGSNGRRSHMRLGVLNLYCRPIWLEYDRKPS